MLEKFSLDFEDISKKPLTLTIEGIEGSINEERYPLCFYAERVCLEGRKDLLKYLIKEDLILGDIENLLKCAIYGEHISLLLWILKKYPKCKPKGGFVLFCLTLNEKKKNFRRKIEKILIQNNLLSCLDRYGIEFYILLKAGYVSEAKWLWQHRHLYKVSDNIHDRIRQLSDQGIEIELD